MIAISPLAQLTALQIHALFKLRVDVFVVEQQCPFAEIDDIDAHPDTRHLLAWSDEDPAELLGCARVFPTDSGSRFGRFVVAPAARGTGLGHEIVRTGIAYTQRFSGDLVIEAQSGLVGYYTGFGFVAEGEEFPDAGIPHVMMRLRR
ncbi:GNAT family N-acetyltransferase [Corynebacterium sanguinis]|uniref:GNAT family N-acetyltransferase n=1 Tax=Corynebacterium sanguinis TaxID=2594913 RepID=UPI0021A644A4|nr:GNAT family N-acetyltransferase [Corynebacterium sanguinis]MCT1462835.1 GNAT family N-acetyltransferase [Corynebacterium sanguinis]MCT2329319.1 GNAT family N-acetyltransferase [Corynebacterium sanguinis]